MIQPIKVVIRRGLIFIYIFDGEAIKCVPFKDYDQMWGYGEPQDVARELGVELEREPKEEDKEEKNENSS